MTVFLPLLAKPSRTVFTRNGESWHPYLNLKRNPFHGSLLGIIFTVGFFMDILYQVKEVTFCSNLLRSLLVLVIFTLFKYSFLSETIWVSYTYHEDIVGSVQDHCSKASIS